MRKIWFIYFFRRTQFLWSILNTSIITMNSTTTTLNHRRLHHPRLLLLHSLPGTRISLVIYHSSEYLPAHLCEALWVPQFRVVVPFTSSAPLLSSRPLLCPFLLLFFLLCGCRRRTRQIRSRNLKLLFWMRPWTDKFQIDKSRIDQQATRHSIDAAPARDRLSVCFVCILALLPHSFHFCRNWIACRNQDERKTRKKREEGEKDR